MLITHFSCLEIDKIDDDDQLLAKVQLDYKKK